MQTKQKIKSETSKEFPGFRGVRTCLLPTPPAADENDYGENKIEGLRWGNSDLPSKILKAVESVSSPDVLIQNVT